MKNLVTLLLLLICCCGFAEAKHHHPYASGFAVLKPSHQSLLLQNQLIDQMGLERVADERRLSYLTETGVLVALPITDAVKIAPSIPSNRRYVLPMVNTFLLELASDYYAEFHEPLTVDSAVRPVTVQKWLRRHNASAAPIHGETASSHEAGCTVDLSRRMSRTETRWLEMRLAYYTLRQVVVVEEESKCFHIMTVKEIA